MKTYKKISDIETPEKTNIVFIPINNILIDESITPINNKHFPEWWKKIESTPGNLRKCHGVSDFITKGYTISMWVTTIIRPALDGVNWECFYDVNTASPSNDNNMLKVGYFDYRQTGKCPISEQRILNEANYIKLVNPWLIKTAPGYSSMLIPTFFTPNKNFTIMPAVINTDYYHHANIVLNILTDSPFSIPAGTPLMHIIPFKRENSNEMEILDESAHRFLNQRGFGGVVVPGSMKGMYKKMQKTMRGMIKK